MNSVSFYVSLTPSLYIQDGVGRGRMTLSYILSRVVPYRTLSDNQVTAVGLIEYIDL